MRLYSFFIIAAFMFAGLEPVISVTAAESQTVSSTPAKNKPLPFHPDVLVIGQMYQPETGNPPGFQLVAREECGRPGAEPHKLRGTDCPGAKEGVGNTKNRADNWDRAVVYQFEGLDPAAAYKLRVVIPVGTGWTHILANRKFLNQKGKDGKLTQSFPTPADSPKYWEFDLPSSLFNEGKLELRFANREGHYAVVSIIELWADRAVKLAPVDTVLKIPSYEELEKSAWKPMRFEGRRFFFKCYDKVGYHKRNSVCGRFAFEAKLQGVLDPIWEWEDSSMLDDSRATGIAEWGYNTSPDGETKYDCYESRRQYFDRNYYPAKKEGKLFGSFTGHGWLEPYAAEWGADSIVTEFGAGSPCVQARMALGRGASRQFDVVFATQTSPWYGGITFYEDGEGDNVPRGGHSSWFQARTWYLTWLGGGAFACPEAAQLSFFQRPPEQKGKSYNLPVIDQKAPEDRRYKLSSTGERAKQFVSVINAHTDIGIPYTPFALILDHYAGFQVLPGAGRVYPWWRLEPTAGDMETALILDTIYPKTVIYKSGDVFNESRLMVNSPYGESFDILLSNINAEKLKLYPVAILLGDHQLTPEFRTTLNSYLKGGGYLVLNQRLANQLGPDIERFRSAGHVLVEEFTRDAKTAKELMDKLTEKYVPMKVEGDIQYTINRTKSGWLVGLIDNKGAWKEEKGPVIFSPAKTRPIKVTPKLGRIKQAEEWVEAKQFQVAKDSGVTVNVPAGDVRIIELIIE